jgi:hypothetical protein
MMTAKLATGDILSPRLFLGWLAYYAKQPAPRSTRRPQKSAALEVR